MPARTDDVVAPGAEVQVGADLRSTSGSEVSLWWRLWPILTIVAMAGVLTWFGFWSQPRSGGLIDNGRFRTPPLYGYFHPVFTEWTLIRLVPAGLLLAAVAWVVTANVRRARPWAVLTLVILSAWVVSVAVNLLRGDQKQLWIGVSTTVGTPYTRDIHLIDELGVRGFVTQFPSLFDQMVSWNARTHPPGVQVFLWSVSKLVHGQPYVFTTVLAFISLGTAAGAWAMGRAYGGERAGRIAAVLAVAAPAVLMLAYTNMDAVFATFFATAAGLLVEGTKRRSALLTGIGGAVLGFGTFLTYATAFLALATAVAVVIETRSVKQSAKLLGGAVVGGVAALLLLRITLGFNVLTCYRAFTRSGSDFYPYWIAGHPASLLIMAGLPLAALGLAGFFVKVPGARRPWLPAILVLVMFIWGTLPPSVTGLRQGEVERTWLFLYPMLAASAGPVIAHWTRAGTRRGAIVAGAVVALLVALSVAQTGVIQSLWDNLS